MPSPKTKGELITGRHAKWYNLRLPLWRYIRRGHLRNVRLAPGQRLLDVGFGTGITLAVLKRQYGNTVDLYGIEPSENMKRQAEALLRNQTNVHLQVGVAEKLPFTNNFFDYVTCSLVMHHLPRAAKLQALQEIRRALKPGGVLVLSDWEKPTHAIGACIGWLWHKHAYVGENTRGILPQLLQEAGFKHVETTAVQAGIVHHLRAVK